MNGRILIVDDEPDMLVLLSRIISEDTDHEVVTENDPQKVLDSIEQAQFDLAILDLRMPRVSGMDLLLRIQSVRPDISVVIMTAFATIENAVEAIREGAFDYISKPFRRERVLLTIDKAMQWRKMLSENIALKEALAEKNDGYPPMIGASPAIKNLIEAIRQVAPTTATVLITGESGTGKELAARAVHRFSLRRDKPFVTVNCTAISENIIESELFGHVKGAFTGAVKDQKGLAELADGGTLFLDEIGDLDYAMQTKLLRLLQEGEYKPVGSNRTLRADIRFVAATHHRLESDIQQGHFREDLFYRLNVVRLEMPSLSRRREDIPLLAHYFLKKYSLLYQKKIDGISEDGLRSLSDHFYAGNIRELENMIERGVIFCRTDRLGPEDLFAEIDIPPQAPAEVAPELLNMPFRQARDAYLDLFCRRYIQALLRNTGGNISRAADKAGIQRQYLHRLIKDLQLETDRFKIKKDPS
jgi:DNA-binding NtrC family response regulator